MSSTNIGHNAETRACDFLQQHRYTILNRNWKTRYCEIDIVTQKKDVIYFVEVKYRRNTKYGSALEYITPKKLRQMQFAAELWVQSHNWEGNYRLATVAIDAEHITFLESPTF